MDLLGLVRWTPASWLSLAGACLAIVGSAAASAESQDAPAAAELDEFPIKDVHRDHWSFRPPVRPDVPAVSAAGWPRNAIDHYILTKLEDAGLEPMPEADPLTLLRRVTFDLTGLPPTPDEIDAFHDDRSPDAYERLVDRLLDSPAYGERWAQHWLDLARFAETDGFEFDKPRPEAWRYRDWVIDALNADMPYAEFVRMQVAGDLLRPGDEGNAAVGFLLCGPDMPDINSQDERRHGFLNDLTGTVGSVFMALQVGCAQCHDHMWDPISQADFYRLRAFFDPTLQFVKDRQLAGPKERGDAPPSRLMVRGDFRRPGPELAPAFLRIANPSDEPVPPPPADAKPASRREALAEWLTRPEHPLTARVIVNRLWQHHFGAGLSRSPSDFGVMGDAPTHPELLDWLAVELTDGGWRLKRMHRLMVTSATYRQASRPSHPGWSEAERSRAAEIRRRAREADPEHHLLCGMPRRRLEGEAIRDALLAASGTLNRRAGGPGVRPPLPEELLATLLKDQWPVTPEVDEHARRSVYLFVRRNLRYPLFEVFDKPDTNASCAARSRSTIAPQALTLLNSELSLSAARSLAGRLLTDAPADRDRQIELAYLRTLHRRPTTEERELAHGFLTDLAGRVRNEARSEEELALPEPLPAGSDPAAAAALTDFCLALFNLNEFVYVD